MCGIAGIVGQLGDANRTALRRINDALRHRGPDGEGYWESGCDDAGWGLMLAHRRLAILDLSDAAAQPMVDPVAGHVMVLNGEIYNYQQLKRSLSEHGHSFLSTGDTAVMLRTLSSDGPDGVDKLRGMFAFAFWNVQERTLLIARDPLGIKPLYIACNPDPKGTWKLAFASEVRALLAGRLIGTPRLNPHALASVLWNGFVVAPETMVAQVEAILPGELRIYDSHGREQVRKQYWTMRAKKSRDPVDEKQLSSVLEESVRLHLLSDVPLGVFLSGGVDSSAVANLAQRAAGDTINTFTVTFEEENYNEGLIAREVANAIGTHHHELLLTERHFTDGLEAALQSLDQPTFDALNSYFMSHAVREAGVKVALVGSGGDELFGGYTTFRDLPALRRMHWMPETLCVAAARVAAGALQRSGEQIPPQTRWAKLPEMLRRRRDLLALYQMAYALFLPQLQRQLLGGGAAEMPVDGLPPSMRARVADEGRGRSTLAAISVFEQRLFLGERLLRDTDAASMSASIEVRLPLVDQVLSEHVDLLPDAQRFAPVRKKALLRRIGLVGLDPALFDRPKSGFVLPYDRWLRSGLGRVVDETMRDAALVKQTGLDPQCVAQLWAAFTAGAPGLYWSRVWAVYVLIWWCQRHGVML
jgi:asparagine synthase (glutamine-hydrolysing)